MATTRSFWLITIYLFLLALFSLFSYSLTDPNLVLSQNQIYWDFQTFMWQHIFMNHQLRFWLYVILILSLFLTYLLFTSSLGKLGSLLVSAHAVRTKIILVTVAVVVVMGLSHNALSHDVFNYMFNARMVLKYQSNPHEKVALDFAQFDDWTRFMHNTHTPAPYGYGWTGISLVPSLLGGEVFLPTWLMFKIFAGLSLFLMYLAIRHAAKVLLNRELSVKELALFFLNPLVLIEVLSSMHNDLWMMAPAMTAIALTVRLPASHQKKWAGQLLLSALLLAFSISIKQATLALLPLWLMLTVLQMKILDLTDLALKRFHLPTTFLNSLTSKFSKVVWPVVPVVAAASMFLPLFTARSQQFLPWYWLWVLCWLPLISWKPIKAVLIAFSFGSALRYLPWLWWGEYLPQVSLMEKIITWGVPIVLLLVWSKFASKSGFSRTIASGTVQDGAQRLIRLE